MRTVLFLEWNSIGNIFMKEAFEKLGFSVKMVPFDRINEDTRRSEKLAGDIVKTILEEPVEFVFSFNFFPVVAIACKACRTKYVSWTYDSPFIQVYSQTVLLDTNRVFIFDKAVCEDLWAKGADTVFYLPMAAAVPYYDTKEPSLEQKKLYDADVTMIGSMYSEKKHNLFRHLDELDAYTRGYLEGVMQIQKQIYGYNFMEQALTPEVMEKVVKVCPIHANGDGFESAEWVFANYFLSRKVTAMERMDIMSLLQEECKVQLFTHEQTPQLSKVQNMGRADYYDLSPLIFKCGKIHLNITLRSILTGIPLRAFDIMGCGGFLLSNFQNDYLEHFVPDEDFVYYESYEDLQNKVRFYLSHEDARERIARCGYEKVKAEHTYENRIQTILNMIE